MGVGWGQVTLPTLGLGGGGGKSHTDAGVRGGWGQDGLNQFWGIGGGGHWGGYVIMEKWMLRIG